MYNPQKYQHFHKGTTTILPMYNGQKYHNFHKGTSNPFTHVQQTEVIQLSENCWLDHPHIQHNGLSAQAYTSTHPALTRSCPTVSLPRLTHPHIQHSPDPVQRSLCPGLLIHTSSTHQILSNGLFPGLLIQHPPDHVQQSLFPGLFIQHPPDHVQRSLPRSKVMASWTAKTAAQMTGYDMSLDKQHFADKYYDITTAGICVTTFIHPMGMLRRLLGITSGVNVFSTE